MSLNMAVFEVHCDAEAILPMAFILKLLVNCFYYRYEWLVFTKETTIKQEMQDRRVHWGVSFLNKKLIANIFRGCKEMAFHIEIPM